MPDGLVVCSIPDIVGPFRSFIFLFMSSGRGECCFEGYFVSVLSIRCNEFYCKHDSREKKNMTEMLASPPMTCLFIIPRLLSVDALAVALIISDIPNTFDMRRVMFTYLHQTMTKGAQTKDAHSAW